SPCASADGHDPYEKRRVASAVEQLGIGLGLQEAASLSVEAHHEGGVLAALRGSDRFLQVVDGRAIDRAVDGGEEDARSLGSSCRYRGGNRDGREGDQQRDARPRSRIRSHSFFSPFLARAAVRDATSPV